MNGKTDSCTFGSYPIIDLSAFFADGTVDGLKEQMTAACEKFGCFHVSIRESSLNDQFGYFKILDEHKVKQTVEQIFDPEFLSSHVSGNSSTVSFADEKDNILVAKFRGREAESGSTSGIEPKQSWEFFRSVSNHHDEKGEGPKELLVLREYTRILHQMTLCIFSILNMEGEFVEKSESPYTMDLLRVFRYDAVENMEEANRNLGSSPHTDWGSLTVVWQDSKGGLQIYCHEQKCWNDVDPPVQADLSLERYIRFFIHVGDFTSLAMSGSSVAPTKEVVWPSPLHRVLCPIRKIDDNDMNINARVSTCTDTRCSLVYFAYPPRGVSIQDAQMSLCPEKKDPTSQSTSNNQSRLPASFPFDRFMVLKDQSQGGDETRVSEAEMYKQIVSQSFDSVIEQKWEQVQR